MYYKTGKNEYREIEKQKNIDFKRDFLKVVDKPVKWKGHILHYFLEDSSLNLLESIRKETLDYFKGKWWKISEEDLVNYEGLSDKELSDNYPTGNMLSSQVSCVNHLFPLRGEQDLVTALLHNIDNRIIKAEKVDDGYIGFEKMGGKDKNPLNEKSPERREGSKSTSIDALMVGKKCDGKSILVLIEWKYTEPYENQKCKFFPNYEPHQGYIQLLHAEDSPIKSPNADMDLFYDPYYQLMRQTLLGFEMVKLKEYDSNEYLNLHIIPYGNVKLRKKITTPIDWKGLLKEQSKYKVFSPEELLQPLKGQDCLNNYFEYLHNRYKEKYKE